MKVSVSLLFLGLLSLTTASKLCGNHALPAPTWLAPLKAETQNNTNVSRTAKRQVTTIKTYMHLVGRNNSMNDLAASRVYAQIAALNDGFKQAGFQFELAGLDRKVDTNPTKDANQAVAATDEMELLMRKSMQKGTYADLNLYFLSDFDPIQFRDAFGAGGTTYGVCRWPELGPSKEALLFDGCVIRQDAMTGSTRDEAKLGYTAVHEVGHWLGLLHVWGNRAGFLSDGVTPDDSDCLDDDEIADTTLQRDSTSGCAFPIGTPGPPSKCPGVNAPDNIHNFMDYSDDVCLNEFSPDQITVMNNIYDMTRRPFRV